MVNKVFDLTFYYGLVSAVKKSTSSEMMDVRNDFFPDGLTWNVAIIIIVNSMLSQYDMRGECPSGSVGFR